MHPIPYRAVHAQHVDGVRCRGRALTRLRALCLDRVWCALSCEAASLTLACFLDLLHRREQRNSIGEHVISKRFGVGENRAGLTDRRLL
jgi:hypothetical protein